MATDITTDSSSRFTIFVPKPNTRINMGKPDADTPFGYKGISMQTDATWFADVNKLIFFQCWKDANFQAIGKWTQWADAGMWMGSITNTTLTSGAKMLVVAGASQSHDMVLDHGLEHVTPRQIEYNNLELHYRIEEVHNGLKTFFYGKNKAWKTPEAVAQGTTAANVGVAPYVAVADQQNDFFSGANYPATGFLHQMHALLEALGYDDDAATKLSVLQPLEWEGGYLDMTMTEASAYSAFRTFDPYPAQGFSGPWTKAYAGFVEVINWLKRTIDVIRRLASGITDNALMRRVQALFTAWGAAQDGLNNILNMADFARFDRATQSNDAAPSGWAFGDEAATFGKRIGTRPAKTAATLTSSSGPFDITGVSAADAYIDVRDIEGGNTVRIDLSEYLVAKKASVTITVASKVTKVAVATSAVADPTASNRVVEAKLTLDGVEVKFTKTATVDAQGVVTAITPSWGTLPSGFAWDATGTILTKGGALFSAAPSGGISLTDQTFEAGDTLKMLIDGTPYDADVAAVNAASGAADIAAGRAAKLAAAINAAHAGAASATGAAVKVQSDKSGAVAQIQVFAAYGTMSKIGMSGQLSAVGKAQGQVTAADLEKKLTGTGDYDVKVSGTAVVVTHHTTGETSYIEISGPLATKLFGGNPKKANGAGTNFWQHLSDVRNIQFEIAKWPEDARHMVRPVVDALSDAVSGLSKMTKDVFDNMMSAVIGTQPKTMALGLIAKDGITLGTSKAIYGAGQSITFVAAPPSEPDDDKFVPGIEKLANLVITYGDATTKALWDRFKPQTKKPGAEPKGDFRIVAARDIVSTAAGDVRSVALKTSSLEGRFVALHSKDKTHITSRAGQVHVQAVSVVVGDVAQDANEARQLPTQTVKIQCQSVIELRAKDLMVYVDEPGHRILLGKHAALPDAVDATKPHLRVDLANGAEKVEVGFTDGNMFGVSVLHDGKVSVNAKTKLALSVQGGAAITIGAADVQIAKQFKVGTALLVKGDGVFTTAPTLAMPLVATRPPLITAAYGVAIVAATAQKLIITTADIAINTAIASLANAPPLSAGLALILARRLYDIQIGIRAPAVQQLLVVQGQWQALVDEARLYDMTDGELGRVEPAHSAIFVVPPVAVRP